MEFLSFLEGRHNGVYIMQTRVTKAKTSLRKSAKSFNLSQWFVLAILFFFFLACSLVGVFRLRFVIVTVYCIDEHWRGSPTAVLLLFLFSIFFKIEDRLREIKIQKIRLQFTSYIVTFVHICSVTLLFYRNSGPGWSILNFCSFEAKIFLWIFLDYREECALFFTEIYFIVFSTCKNMFWRELSRVHSWHILN